MNKWLGMLCLAGLSGSGATISGELAVGGAAAVYDSAIRGAEERSAAIPLVYYEGERFHVQFTSIAFHVVRGESFKLSLRGAGRFDGFDSNDSPYLLGMHDRDPAFEMGAEASFGNLALAFVTDVTGTHEGSEASLTYTHGFDLGRLRLHFAPTLIWQDARLAHYYYGVRASEQANLNIDDGMWLRTAYQADEALIPRISALALYEISERWSVVTGGEVSYLPREISDSPIVDKSLQWGVFTGLAYHFR